MMAENLLSPARLLYAIMFILPPIDGVLKFTLEPPNPSYARNGSNAKLVWDFSMDTQGELLGIIYSVKGPSGAFTGMLVKLANGSVVNHQSIPAAYKGRVRIEGRASLVVENVTPRDNTEFKCALAAKSGADLESIVKLIVTEIPEITPPSIQGRYIEGSSVNITCSATGKPDPDVSWIRNGQIQSSGRKTASLNFDQIKRTDDGLYTCTANNSAGKKVHKEILVVLYPANILSVTSSAAKSWIGQTVTLKCVSDGVPTSTLTWYKPDGTKLNTDIAEESTVKMTTTDDEDFGEYKCVAYNGLDPSNNASLTLGQIHEPGFPVIISSATGVQATSLIVKWTAPADDGGSPITAYRVVILMGGTEIKNVNITDPGIASLSVGELERDTEYNVKVFARNAVFEGAPRQKTIRTKTNGIPETPDIIDVPAEIHSDEVDLKWSTPSSNGADITQYTVYIRDVYSNGTVGDWRTLEVIFDVVAHEYVVTLTNGQQYDLVVTATNQYGESLKEQHNIKRIRVLGESTRSTANQNQTVVRCNNELEVLHAAYLSVIFLLVIIIVVITVIHWRIRQDPVLKFGQRSSAHADSIHLTAVDNQAAEFQSTALNDATSTTYEIPNSDGEYMPLHPSTRSWEIRREQVHIIKNIGKGAFSQVAEASAKNIYGNQGVMTVAVKMLKDNAPESDRVDLLSELEVMKNLKPHPHVIKLMGCVTESDPLLVLIEYVPYGDLLGYLRKSRGLNDTYFDNPDRKPETNLTSKQLMRFAWQIADGMAYLSSRKIIHRDLAARNVLVGEEEKCKVTDFGMARNVQQDDIYTKQSRGRLPVKWTAYEALLYRTYTTQSDVWSYGVLLYEILTIGGSPYPGVNARQIATKLQEGFRMPKPKHVDNKLYQIMLKCWEENPSDRPTFAKLKETMKEMERNHKTYVNLKEYDNALYANSEDLAVE